MMKHAVPEMKKAGGGAIVNVSSAAALRGGGIYGVTKAAVVTLTRSVALMHARDKVRANTVLPAYIDSTISRRLMGDRESRAVALVPLARSGTVWELAEGRLGNREWAIGRYSIADIHLFRLFWRFHGLIKLTRGEFPNLWAHYDRIMARPAVKKTIEIETAIGQDLPA